MAARRHAVNERAKHSPETRLQAQWPSEQDKAVIVNEVLAAVRSIC